MTSTVPISVPPPWSPDDKDAPTGACQADDPDSPVESKARSPTQCTGSDPQITAAPSQKQEDNEFILDGFDFSTGVSICQALDLDEDEVGSTTTEKSSLLLSNNEVTDPSELLLKALGVSKETTGSMENKAAPPQHTTGEPVPLHSGPSPRAFRVVNGGTTTIPVVQCHFGGPH